MTRVYINEIATATPAHDVHAAFVAFAPTLLANPRERSLYQRMADRSQIAHRYSCLSYSDDPATLDSDGFYRSGDFPGTAARMEAYKRYAFPLVRQAIDQLRQPLTGITHLIVTSCTGFYAPGIDLEIVKHYGLSPTVERTIIGFMGCYAAINALKLADHIVRSQPAAQVLTVNIELCTLHLHDDDKLEELLSFTIFADGCAASLVSATACGLEITGFWSTVMPDSTQQITWHIGDLGFDMLLSGEVPKLIGKTLAATMPQALNGLTISEIALWAAHPGGRTILDAIEQGLQLPAAALATSRDILRRFGNMSSATVMFVLQAMLNDTATGPGCALAFGPGVTLESMRFQKDAA